MLDLIKRRSILFVLPLFIMLLFTRANKVEAYAYCKNKIETTELYDCGKRIYAYTEDISHSSQVVALEDDSSILYAGNIGGSELFYANGFKYYNYSYDDRSSANNNLWAILTNEGKLVYDGTFKDTIINDSHQGYFIFNLRKDVYTIKQYTNNGKNLYRVIVIHNYKEGEVNYFNAKFNDSYLEDDVVEVLPLESDFTVDVNSKFGVKSARIIVNGNSIDASYVGGEIIANYVGINENLIKGEVNDIVVEVTDYLGLVTQKTYKVMYVNENVSIKLSTMSSIIETTSRRIVIQAIPGKGKTVDTDYNWYYWSLSPDDSLTYDDFLLNYAKSDYKGSYSDGKGVILRNLRGTYYLYALAKDEDSSIVIRSEGYVLNDPGYSFNFTITDGIVVLALLICSIIPVSIYLYVRRKGY